MYSREITASDVVESTFEKIAKLNYAAKKPLGKAIKNTLSGANIKNAINDINVATKAGASASTLKGLKKDRNKQIAKTVGVYGAGAAGLGGSALAANKSRQKTACDIVDESFEKVAKLNFAAKKPLGKAVKNTLNGTNIKNAVNDIKVATKAGASASTLKGLKKDRNKQIAKTVGAYGAGVAGLGGGTYGATSRGRNEE